MKSLQIQRKKVTVTRKRSLLGSAGVLVSFSPAAKRKPDILRRDIPYAAERSLARGERQKRPAAGIGSKTCPSAPVCSRDC